MRNSPFVSAALLAMAVTGCASDGGVDAVTIAAPADGKADTMVGKSIVPDLGDTFRLEDTGMIEQGGGASVTTSGDQAEVSGQLYVVVVPDGGTAGAYVENRGVRSFDPGTAMGHILMVRDAGSDDDWEYVSFSGNLRDGFGNSSAVTSNLLHGFVYDDSSKTLAVGLYHTDLVTDYFTMSFDAEMEIDLGGKELGVFPVPVKGWFSLDGDYSYNIQVVAVAESGDDPAKPGERDAELVEYAGDAATEQAERANTWR